MQLKDFDILKNLWLALKQFFNDNGLDKCSILAYYSIFSSLFILAFFTFIFTKFFGNPEIAIRSVYPFTPEFFLDISPDIFEKAGQISAKLKSFGFVGLIFAGFFSFLVLKRIIQFVNDMFHIDIEAHKSEKGFFIRRLTEVGLLAVIGIMMTGSFFFTNFVTSASAQFTDGKNSSLVVSLETVQFVDTFLIKYLLPFLITFFFFFIIFKWIPSKVVYLKGAFISALISTILCEIVKRIYAYYLVHVSLFGKIRGPIVAIILFGFWMEISIGIMLYGAKLTYIFDKEKNDKIRRAYTVS